MGHFKRAANCFNIAAVNCQNIPVPGAIFSGSVFVGNVVNFSGKLNVVGVVEHNQVAQTEMAGNASGTLRNLFLNTAVGNISISFMGNNIAELGNEHTFCQSATNGHYMTLAKRAGGVLYAAVNVELGVAGSNRTPLAEFLKFFKSIAAGQRQNAIEHGRHMARIHKETVAGNPTRISGVIN